MAKKYLKRLTTRQREILDFIDKYISENGYAPTLKEIGQAFGFSDKAASDHRDALIRKGRITFDYTKPRSIRLTPISRMFSIQAKSTLEQLGIEEGDILTVSPADSPVAGDLVLSVDGKFTTFQQGQAVVGKVIGVSRQL